MNTGQSNQDTITSIEIGMHLLDMPYTHTRVKNNNAIRSLKKSIGRIGQTTPVTTVKNGERFILIDGYLPYHALKANNQETIIVAVVNKNEDDALFDLLITSKPERKLEVIEYATIIKSIRDKFNKWTLEQIGNRINRDKSWVSRQINLVESLPDEILQAVMSGNISSWTAARILAPLARANLNDAKKITSYLQKNPMSTREIAELYEHYKKSNRSIRGRIVSDPQLFMKDLKDKKQSQEVKKISEGPEGIWLHDLNIVRKILEKLVTNLDQIYYPSLDSFRSKQRQQNVLDVANLIDQITKKEKNMGASYDEGSGHTDDTRSV